MTAQVRRPVGRGYVFPVSPAQQRLWFLDRLTPGRSSYSIQATVPLGPAQPGLVQRTVDELVRRHESLRTTFDELEGLPVQVVHDEMRTPVRLKDTTALPPERRHEAALRVAAAESGTPFDLVTGPLLRVTLVRTGRHAHLLMVTMHHIVSDGWSLSVFFGDFVACYEALASGRPSPLPPLQVQYADFTMWQADRLAELAPEHVAYWRDHLADLRPLDLPTDRPRPRVPSSTGATHHFELSPAVVSRLRALARQEGATLFMTLLAAYLATLRRHSSQHDLAVGVPVASRDRAELEPLIGFFVNMLVMRVQVDDDETFRGLLGRVRSEVLDAFVHQEVPFDKVVEELHEARDLSRHPVFQVAFQLHQRQHADTPADARTGRTEIPRTSSNFDLHVELWPDGDALAGRVAYATDLFDPATVSVQAQHYVRLLDSAAADPDRPVGSLVTTPDEERRQLLSWGVGRGTHQRDASVVDLVEAAVDRDPRARAVTAGPVQLSYLDLDRRANALAHGLLSYGLRPGEPVGVVADRSAALVVALLGVLKAGGAYVGIEPEEPPARLAALLRRVGCRTVLALGGRAALIEGHCAEQGISVLPLDGRRALSAGRPTDRPAIPVRSDDLAYISFTSGSTGEPKGVAVTHSGVARLVTGTSFHTITSEETFALLSPIAFDASTMEVWGALANGARLVVHPPGPFSLAALGRFIEDSEVSTLFLTAGLFHQMVDAELPRLARVSTLMSGGDVLSAPHIRRVLALPGRRVVVNAYGPTENASYTTCHVMTDPARVPDRVPIGRPISGTTVYVLDEHLRLSPIGVPGDLWTGGDGLARGYVGDEAATRAAFVEGPFRHVPAARLYRTGDRARWRADGTLDFLGRADRQVKVRGFRVEPGEVEVALLAAPEVEDASVVVLGDRPDDRRLVAFVVPSDPVAPPDPAVLRGMLAGGLPRHLLPSLVRVIDRLPLTRNGKVDRQALLRRVEADGTEERQLVPPSSEFESALVPLWAEVLDLPGLGVTDDFFADLGGHSLLGTRLVARVRDAFDVDLPLRALFEAPTVRGMALEVEALVLDQLQAQASVQSAGPGGAP